MQSLSYDSQAVKAMNLESTAEQFALFFFALHSLCCLLYFFLLFIFAPLMKQCKNFILCLIFLNLFQSRLNFKQNQSILFVLINQSNKFRLNLFDLNYLIIKICSQH